MQNKIDDPEWLSHLCWWMVDPTIYGWAYYRVRFRVVCLLFLYQYKESFMLCKDLSDCIGLHLQADSTKKTDKQDLDGDRCCILNLDCMFWIFFLIRFGIKRQMKPLLCNSFT